MMAMRVSGGNDDVVVAVVDFDFAVVLQCR